MKRLTAMRLLTILTCGLLAGCVGGQATAAQETIGIIGAMDTEVAYLRQEADIKKTTVIAGMEFCEGTPEGKNVVMMR